MKTAGDRRLSSFTTTREDLAAGSAPARRGHSETYFVQ
jgi:hypothetical protein